MIKRLSPMLSHNWRRVCHLLVILGLVCGMVSFDLGFNASTAQAEPSAPEPAAAYKPSPALQMYTAGIQMAPNLPDLLGFTEPKSYLLLLQNNHELRATGGFITAVGRITVANGRLTELVIQDSYEIARHDVDHPLAPEPVKRFMGIQILFLRDANWSPDFPTTARLTSSLYAQDTGVRVDGVISADLRAVQLLIDALAPLPLADSDVVLTGENVIQEMMHFWDRPPSSDVESDVETESLLDRKDWVHQRKDFMPMIAEAVNARLAAGDFNALRLLTGITTALNERAIQVWLEDPAAAEAMAQQGWDGRLHPEAGADFVALVDTNMGYNKVNALLKRTVAHRVEWPAGPTAPAQATVIVTYRHPAAASDEICVPRTDFATIDSYKELTERCYFGYVRLYVPAGSKLVSIEGVAADSIVAQPGERATMTLAGYFSMRPGEEHVVTFTYTLPDKITLDNYSLVVQRQAGAGPLPIEVSVDDTAFSLTLIEGRMRWPDEPPSITTVR